MRRAVVQEWHAEDGWGVVAGDQLPGPCWVHYAVVEMPGYRELVVGADVLVEYEEAAQDGYRFRATSVRLVGASGPTPESGSSAYSSRLTIEFDESSD
jgi:CspA family cold shock protein